MLNINYYTNDVELQNMDAKSAYDAFIKKYQPIDIYKVTRKNGTVVGTVCIEKNNPQDLIDFKNYLKDKYLVDPDIEFVFEIIGSI